MTALKPALPLLASIAAVLAIAAVVIGALVLRYGAPSGTTLAVEACVDQASPASTFVASESFSVDAVLGGNQEGLEGWPLVAMKVESAYSTEDAIEAYWVIGSVDDTTEAVCVVEFSDGVLVGEPTFVDAAAFATFQ